MLLFKSNPSIRMPLQSGHFLGSQLDRVVYKTIPEMRTSPLITTFLPVPRVCAIKGSHCERIIVTISSDLLSYTTADLLIGSFQSQQAFLLR